MISQHGAELYDAYFTSKLRPDDPRMLQTLETALRLLEYATPNRDELYVAERYSETTFPGSEEVFVLESPCSWTSRQMAGRLASTKREDWDPAAG